MRSEAKLTSKGQITVPKEIRRALGVEPGDKIAFERNGNNISMRRVRPKGVFEKYRGTVDLGIGHGREAVIRAVRELRDPD
jgi:AbrB family looped-hinge helix DNA binding protein